MATQCSDQATTAAPACVPTGQAACGSLQEAATVVMTPCRPFVFAILVLKVKPKKCCDVKTACEQMDFLL